MKLPWEREARQINSQLVSTKALELETAKEILSEVSMLALQMWKR